MTLTELLGETLCKGEKGATVKTAEALDGKKAVGLYFSAHWCPPCRGFTPKLAEAYEKHLSKLGLEIVFVSSDQTTKAFDEYFGEQPWLALPYEERDLKKKLSKKFKVSGIPSLIILDPDGNTITTDGRSCVTSDPEGTDFPWIPPTLEEIVADATFLDKDGNEHAWADYRGQPLGLYFSAHWCGPCRGFTPELVKTYEAVKEGGKDFEIIFVSSDQDEKAFKEYWGEMPWHALKFEQRKIKGKLSDHFGVEGIPTFVMLDGEGKTITVDARGAVGADPKGLEFPWEPKPINDLHNPDGINDTPSVCLMLEGVPEAEQGTMIAAFESVAEPIFSEAKAKGGDQPYLFFVAKKGGGVVDRVRQLCKLGDATAKPQLLIVDVPEEGSYTLAEEVAVDGGSIKSFLDDYAEGGKLTMTPFE